jgi:hypothetical protein
MARLSRDSKDMVPINSDPPTSDPPTSDLPDSTPVGNEQVLVGAPGKEQVLVGAPGNEHEQDKEQPGREPVGGKPEARNTVPTTDRKAGKNLIKEAVNRIDDRERRYGFIAAVIAAVLWLLLTVPILVHPAKPHKGQLGTEGVAIYLVVGLLLAGLIFFASWIRRRALLGFTVLFTGFSFGADLLFAIPFYFLGAWLIWRAMKIQREAQAALQAAGTSRSSSIRQGRQKEPSNSRWGRMWSRTGRTEEVRRTPTASRRYTPPRSAKQSSKRR